MIRKRYKKHKYAVDAVLGDTKPSIRIGGRDKVAQGKFIPNLNMSFRFGAGEEFFVNLNRRNVSVTDQQETDSNGALRLTTGTETDIWEIDADGRMRWDIDFAECPDSMVMEWDLLCSPGVEFYYQPPLTTAEIAEGHIRPPEVVGSYAVYCNRRNNQYKTGKLAHIYRPYCTDARGRKAWAELSIVQSKMRVTLPKRWMCSAAYPVRLDPTLGYTTAGASSMSFSQNRTTVFDYNSTAGSDGTLDSVSFYVNTLSTDSADVSVAVYDGAVSTSSNLVDYSNKSEYSEPASNDWVTIDLTQSGAVVDGNTYCPAINNSATVYLHYDTGSGSWVKNYYAYSNTPPFDDPLGSSNGSGTEIVSCYLTYTESAGTTYYQSVSGSSPSPAGALSTAFTMGHSISGDMPAAQGALIKKVNKSLSGISPEPTGESVKKIEKQALGNVPYASGLVMKKTSTAVAGNMPASSGQVSAVLTNLAQAIFGNMPSPIGAVTKKIGKQLLGNSPAATGSAIKKISKRVNGNQLGPTGDVDTAFNTSQNTSGNMPTPTGILSTVLNPIVSAATSLIKVIGSGFKKLIG